MINLGSLDAWTATPATTPATKQALATETPALNTLTSLKETGVTLNPTDSIKLKDLVDFSRTGASPEALFKAVNGEIPPSGAKITAPLNATEAPPLNTDTVSATASPVYEPSLIPGIDKKTLEGLTKNFNGVGTGTKSVQEFIYKPLKQMTQLMKKEPVTETEIFQPALEGLASDAGLDPQTKAAVEQERIKRREIESQFGKTPYGAVNLKKQAYLELARHDLPGALKLQEEMVQTEQEKIARKKAELETAIAKEKETPPKKTEEAPPPKKRDSKKTKKK
jgi:hypothetical protein